MKRDAIVIIEFENVIYTTANSLKSFLVKAFPHNHFHEVERNLLPFKFYRVCVPIHVNFSFTTTIIRQGL